MPLSLNVWERERDPDVLVVAADEDQISKLERRRLATVERVSTVGDFVSKFAPRSETEARRKEHERKCRPPRARWFATGSTPVETATPTGRCTWWRSTA